MLIFIRGRQFLDIHFYHFSFLATPMATTILSAFSRFDIDISSRLRRFAFTELLDAYFSPKALSRFPQATTTTAHDDIFSAAAHGTIMRAARRRTTREARHF